MENNETWRDRFNNTMPPPSTLGITRRAEESIKERAKDFFASELLSLADKIGAERKEMPQTISTLNVLEVQKNVTHNAALDTAISVIKEMAK